MLKSLLYLALLEKMLAQQSQPNLFLSKRLEYILQNLGK